MGTHVTSYFRTAVRDDRETEIEVEIGVITWGEPTTRDDPGCGPEVEILDAWLLSDADKADAPSITLTDTERERIEIDFMENPPEDDYDDYD